MERPWKLGQDLCFGDEIGGGVTFDDVITAVQCNSDKLTYDSVIEEALSCLEMQREDFWFLLRNNVDEILVEVRRRRGIKTR